MSFEALRRDVERVRQLVGPSHPLDLPSDPVAFARLLKDPDTGEPIEPDPWQREFLTTSKKRVILACGRQVGKSTIVAICALRLVLTNPDSLVLVCARTLTQAGELTRKIYTFYRQLGRPIPARVDRQLSLELINGSRVVTLPGAQPDNVRGYSAPAVVIVDEAAFIDDRLYFALDPMLSVSGGKLFLLSSPNGKVGAFWEIWENGDPDEWLKIRVPSLECARVPADFIERRRNELPWWIFDQELGAQFTEQQEAVFRLEDIERAIDPQVHALFPGGWDG